MAAQHISIQRAKTRGNAPAAEGGSRRALRLHGRWLHELSELMQKNPVTNSGGETKERKRAPRAAYSQTKAQGQ